jgi:hypothetical protein
MSISNLKKWGTCIIFKEFYPSRAFGDGDGDVGEILTFE